MDFCCILQHKIKFIYYLLFSVYTSPKNAIKHLHLDKKANKNSPLLFTLNTPAELFILKLIYRAKTNTKTPPKNSPQLKNY